MPPFFSHTEIIRCNKRNNLCKLFEKISVLRLSEQRAKGYSRAMNVNGRTHAGSDPEGVSPVESDGSDLLLWEAADPCEDKAARAHLEGVGPADLLDDELGPQRFGA